jgi:FemAB-related protein (PEP-CTERM system-associated)
MKIKLLADNELHLWNDFVKSSSLSTFCHRAEWKSILESVYNLKTHYIYVEESGNILGILPLAEVKSFLFGHTLISTPFCVYGGICSESNEATELLTNETINIARQLNVDYIELRNLSQTQNNWQHKDFYHTFKKEISADNDVNLNEVPRKQRAMIRKGIKNDLISIIDDDINTFYHLYATSVRNLGTPVYPKKYFVALKDKFGDDCEFLTVTKNGKAISSVLSFYFDNTVLPYYAGGLPEARSLKAYDFMYWELMRRSAEKNISKFDFGRSIEGTGSFSFKKNWGFKPQQLYYQQFLINANQTPDFNPANTKYSMYIKAWQKLPLPIANLIGPLISKNLG